MAFSIETYAKSKGYTDETVVGGGAIKGKNCTIESITPITGGNRVTFKWTLDDGTVQTDTMDVMDGEDGKGIKRVYVNEEDHLIIVYDDDTTSDAGEVIVYSSVDSVNGKTGVVELTASDVGALPDDTVVPSKTSDLTNDSNFVADASYVHTDNNYDATAKGIVDGVTTSLADKVDKVAGKGLSENDYTDADKAIVDGVTTALSGKVDKNGTDSLMTADEHTKLSGIAAGAEVNVQSDWNEADSSSDAYIAHKPNIPTKTSDLTNDSGFIANTVDNLVNYYTKSQTYTQSEVDALISAIVTLNISSVAELPTTNISTTTIYLVPSADPGTQNVKDEYINLDGTTAGWELIGSTAIDLTGYVTDSELSTALADYVTSTSLASTLSGYVQKSQTAGLLKNDGTVDTNTYATTSALSDKISKSSTAGLVKNDGTIDTTSYATTSALNDKVSKSQTAGLLKNDGTVDTNSYATTTALSDKVDKVTGKGLSTNDYDNTAKGIVDGVTSALANKVDKNGTDSLMTADEHTKLSGIASGAEVNVQSDWNVTDDTSDAFIKNKPTIPAAQVNSDWNASSGVAQILNKPNIPDTTACYQTGDTAETALDDADYVPFYDTSASAKRKSLWSNIKNVLKTYFDSLYSAKATSKGSATKGVYFDANGAAQEMTYTVSKSVPSDAVFTDKGHTIVDSIGASLTQRSKLQFSDMAVTDKGASEDKIIVKPYTPDYVDEQYNNSTTYSKGMTCISGNKRYRYINSTASSGHQPPNATYWEVFSVTDELNGWTLLGKITTTTDYLTLPSSFKEMCAVCLFQNNYSSIPYYISKKAYDTMAADLATGVYQDSISTYLGITAVASSYGTTKTISWGRSMLMSKQYKLSAPVLANTTSSDGVTSEIIVYYR